MCTDEKMADSSDISPSTSFSSDSSSETEEVHYNFRILITKRYRIVFFAALVIIHVRVRQLESTVQMNAHAEQEEIHARIRYLSLLGKLACSAIDYKRGCTVNHYQPEGIKASTASG